MTLLMPDGPGPIYASSGDAAVSYLPGHAHAEMRLAVHGQTAYCTASEARDLLAALIEAFSAATNLRPANGLPDGEEG